ncbi:hypothetical protein Q4Q34_14905 [Flavivirga abyssicola]|uniref:hypothetical protein n=1 Tax=Flavivirga abyssicola TaxID=3063533 RepID=UPI0026E071E2|nr:hypothetical protein [Flavivirga sp. MEBiC07777]WVK12509.1 hypothetical protein Q4Q34_14905 [Flavivirga sp. MEBiC07777]
MFFYAFCYKNGKKTEGGSALRQYLFEDRAISFKTRLTTTQKLYFRLIPIGLALTQVMKVLKTINYKVTNNDQIRASVIALWVQNNDLRTAQKKARHRFITSTESYKKYDPNTNRSAADVFHLMR